MRNARHSNPGKGPTKGERTRQRLFDTAVRSFQHIGYEATSLRMIATEAGVTPALLYRYFRNKEAIVAELYTKALLDWSERSQVIPEGTWSARTLWLTQLAFDVLAPYRDLLRVLSGSMITGDPATSPLHSDQAKLVAGETFLRAVTGANDAPPKRYVAEHVDLAYVGHLGLILFWVMDKTPKQEATARLMDQAAELAPLFKLGLKMPRIGPRLRAIGPTLMAGLKGEAP